MTPLSELRAWTAYGPLVASDERRQRLTLEFARRMHAVTCGGWGAAGYDTRLAFVRAADAAVASLVEQGHDMLDVVFPED